MYHHLQWRPLLLAAAALAFIALTSMPPSPARAQHIGVYVSVDLRDEHLRCDGDSARISVVATRDGEPAAGLLITVDAPLGVVPTTVMTTNRHGLASGWVTPRAGTAARFTYMVHAERRHVFHIGRCPLVPGPDTIPFSARVVDENGRPIAGERVGAATFGYSPSLAMPPQWTRSDADGTAGWDGIPGRLWDDIDITRQSRFVCLGEHSRFDIASVNGVPVIARAAPRPIADHTGSCVQPPLSVVDTATFELRRSHPSHPTDD